MALRHVKYLAMKSLKKKNALLKVIHSFFVLILLIQSSLTTAALPEVGIESGIHDSKKASDLYSRSQNQIYRKAYKLWQSHQEMSLDEIQTELLLSLNGKLQQLNGYVLKGDKKAIEAQRNLRLLISQIENMSSKEELLKMEARSLQELHRHLNLDESLETKGHLVDNLAECWYQNPLCIVFSFYFLPVAIILDLLFPF